MKKLVFLLALCFTFCGFGVNSIEFKPNNEQTVSEPQGVEDMLLVAAVESSFVLNTLTQESNPIQMGPGVGMVLIAVAEKPNCVAQVYRNYFRVLAVPWQSCLSDTQNETTQRNIFSGSGGMPGN